MSQAPRVLLVVHDLSIQEAFRDIARQCQIHVLPVSDCEEAQHALPTGRWDIVLIAVDSRVIRASLRNDGLFASDAKHWSIHHQDVKDVGKLLEEIRTQSRSIRVGLFSDDHDSMGLPLVFRLMGCDYVFGLGDLRRNFREIVEHLCQVNPFEDGISKQIFLSYARADVVQVRLMYRRLLNLKLNPWIDSVNIPLSAAWNEEIRQAIQNSAFFLPHFSSNSVESCGMFREEIALAFAEWRQRGRDNRYHLISVLLENVDIPSPLSALQWVNMHDGQPHGLTRLLQAILRGTMYPLPQGEGERVLVVDQDRHMGNRCIEKLHQAGYTASCCHNTKTALQALAARPFAVVILDLMTDRQQRVLCTIERQPHTRVILTTAAVGGPFIPHLHTKVFRYLPKNPYQFDEELLVYVHEALQGLRRAGDAL